MSNLNKFLESFNQNSNNEINKIKEKEKSTNKENLFNIKDSNTKENINKNTNKKLRLNIKNNKNTANNKKIQEQNDKKENVQIKEKEINKRIKLNKEENKVKSSNNINKIKEKEEIKKNNELSNEELEILFIKSETPEIFKSKWMELYRKAESSNKNTITNSKILNGRFRFKIDGDFEILADHETNGKSSKQLLNETWKIK